MSGLLDKVLRRDTGTRVKMIQYLGNVKSPEGIAELIRYMSDENVEIRRAACCSLEQHWMTGNKNALIAMTKALEDPDGEVRKKAATGIGGYVTKSPYTFDENEAAKKALIRMIKAESDPEITRWAAFALGMIHDPSVIGQMAEAFKGKDRKTITMSIDAINDLPQSQVRTDMKMALRAIL